MQYKPHTYQTYATGKIMEQEAVGLFLDMGLGKTVITLTAIEQLQWQECNTGKALIIAPLRVAKDTWAREAQKWDHLKGVRLSRVLGTEKQRIQALNVDADVYITNRENVSWIVSHFKDGKTWPFDMIVIDELSSFKDQSSQRFKALRKVRPKSQRIVGLTGTPAPNGLIDLWSQVYLLDRGERLGKTIGGYRESYFDPGRRDRSRGIIFDWNLKPGADAQIHERISDLCVSMRAEDWLDVPDRIERIVPISLEDKLKDYDRLERDMILALGDDIITAGSAAAVTGKLQQYAQGAVYNEDKSWTHVHDLKTEALDELIEEANGKPVLVFYWFRHDLERLKSRYKGARTLDEPKDIDDWNAGKIPVLLAHPASAGHGLNLQAGGNIIIWFSLTWSLELYEQANARLHRQGQEQAVIVHHLVAEKTVDEDIIKALITKAEGQNALMEAVRARIRRWQDG
jgi:SNF2 family DNA or RNA helicase